MARRVCTVPQLSDCEDVEGNCCPSACALPAPRGTSVPMMMRHQTPGNLDLRARKDNHAHAHAPDTDRCRGRHDPDRRSTASVLGGACFAISRIISNWPRRRTFTARDKIRILAETDRAAETGGIGAILRREGVYLLSLTEWRKQRDAGVFGALVPAKRGPKAAEPNPLAAKLTSAQRDNARFTLRVKRAEAIIELQEKVAELLGIPLAPNGDEPSRKRLVALAPDSRITAVACAALGVSRASVQRRRARLTASPAIRRPRPRPARALTAPATADRAGSVARAALRRPGTGLDLRQPAR